MPRYSRIPAILRTVKHAQPKINPEAGSPRLWNAKRRIKVSQALTHDEFRQYRKNPTSTAWRTQTSPDVVEFIDQNTIDPQTGNPLPPEHSLLPRDIANILRSPADYFSRPFRVPVHSRKQVYFPDFSVTMIRKPKDSPFFASFSVPLWFNKLDMKSYLKELYHVDVVHVRSFVLQKSLMRKKNANPRRRGAWYRAPSEKRMKVQLVEPFEWPAEVTDFEEFDKDEFWRIFKAQSDEQTHMGPQGKLKPNNWYRHTIAKQARDLVTGQSTWAPSWQQIPSDVRILEGVTETPRKPKSRLRPTLRKDVRVAQNLPLRGNALGAASAEESRL